LRSLRSPRSANTSPTMNQEPRRALQIPQRASSDQYAMAKGNGSSEKKRTRKLSPISNQRYRSSVRDQECAPRRRKTTATPENPASVIATSASVLRIVSFIPSQISDRLCFDRNHPS